MQSTCTLIRSPQYLFEWCNADDWCPSNWTHGKTQRRCALVGTAVDTLCPSIDGLQISNRKYCLTFHQFQSRPMFRSCLIVSRSAAVGSFELRFGGDILSLGFVKASTRDHIARQAEPGLRHDHDTIAVIGRTRRIRGLCFCGESKNRERDHNKLYLIIRLLLPHQRRGATLESHTTEQMPITYNCRASSWATDNERLRWDLCARWRSISEHSGQ